MLGSARLKMVPGDFEVEEILGFEPSGEGEHCLLWIEKTGWNTNDVAGYLAGRLGIRKRLVSHCGLKDLQAVTRQWFSIHLPGSPSPEAGVLGTAGVRVLRVTRNGRKLRRGAHDGNRFAIRLRDCDFSREAAAERWEQIVARGAPNYFGKQRFGRDGCNVARASRMFAGEIEVRDRLVRGMYLSAVRSFLFNAIVAERVARGRWDRLMDGEVFGFAANRSLVLPTNLRGDEEARFARGELEVTAPLWGAGDSAAVGDVAALESRVAHRYPDLVAGLEAAGLRQERRVIRLRPGAPEASWEKDDLSLRFRLPRGAYATTILRELAELRDGSASG